METKNDPRETRGNFARIAFFWVLCYILCAITAVGLTFGIGKVFYLPLYKSSRFISSSNIDLDISLLYPILIQIPFYLYFSKSYLESLEIRNVKQLQAETYVAAFIWLGLTIFSDFVLWIVLPSRYQLSFLELYWEFIPWMLMMYATVFASTLSAMLAVNKRKFKGL